MLSAIHIRDFTIIDRLELSLGTGMTVITGETGAGKSILVDALGLALGDRADSATVRPGAERAEIAVEFELARDAEALEWLAELELDDGQGCHLRRVIRADGRSRAFVNGRPAPVSTLRELGDRLVQIHGQHEHQKLTKRDQQRRLIDDFGGHGELVRAVGEAHRRWREAQSELDELRSATGGSERAELLRHQVRELEELGLERGEIDRLDAEHARLANASGLLGVCQSALERLGGDENYAVGHVLSELGGELERWQAVDGSLAEPGSLIRDAAIQLQEAVDALRRYEGTIELDPQRLEEVDRRLGLAHDLARKHRVDAGELPDVLERLRAELQRLDHADERLAELAEQVAEREREYNEQAAALSERRQSNAKRLAEAVTEHMQALGMEGGRFTIDVSPNWQGKRGPEGVDSVELNVSANPGHPPRPLRKVASGGELARISLAVEVAALDVEAVPTMVFDEVDAGIGGAVAEIVGDKLRQVGESCQVLCVTHLPQVAAQAHQHLVASKEAAGEATVTRVAPLGGEDRTREIARMLGGVEITDQTTAHAREMLARTGPGQ